MLKLTKRNYHSEEANRVYWSASLIKQMLICPAAAMAMEPAPPSTALLVGSYVDAFFEGPKSFDRFKAEHPELMKKDGTLKADFLKAEPALQDQNGRVQKGQAHCGSEDRPGSEARLSSG